MAVADDLGTVPVIAFFYTDEINFISLTIGGGFLLILVLGNIMGVRNSMFYLIIGIGLWIGFLLSGVHATIAGVLVALANAGIVIGSDFFSSIINPVSIGVAAGLVVGKFSGILLFCWIMGRISKPY